MLQICPVLQMTPLMCFKYGTFLSFACGTDEGETRCDGEVEGGKSDAMGER